MLLRAALISIILSCACAAQVRNQPVIPPTVSGTRELLNLLREVVEWEKQNWRAWQNYSDSNKIWCDTIRTDGGGLKVVYLPFKYDNEKYFIGSAQLGVGTRVSTGVISDSSFLITTTNESSVAISAYVPVVTIGVKKRGQ